MQGQLRSELSRPLKILDRVEPPEDLRANAPPAGRVAEAAQGNTNVVLAPVLGVGMKDQAVRDQKNHQGEYGADGEGAVEVPADPAARVTRLQRQAALDYLLVLLARNGGKEHVVDLYEEAKGNAVQDQLVVVICADEEYGPNVRQEQADHRSGEQIEQQGGVLVGPRDRIHADPAIGKLHGLPARRCLGRKKSHNQPPRDDHAHLIQHAHHPDEEDHDQEHKVVLRCDAIPVLDVLADELEIHGDDALLVQPRAGDLPT
mmetsp:Transcript_7360/g.16782  ORF Transcript_7360/g.16782 Transcript_7360/m.16782 type:complete len:260 (+) Transcript_7360:91-870(+)